MMFVSFNVNSIRTRMHQLEALIKSHEPDVIGLQETKVSDDDFPVDAIEALGYHVQYHGQKTHYGVALMTRAMPESVTKGFPGDDSEAQKRLITGHFRINGEPLTVINGYFPQGESRNHPVKFPAKQKFYADLMQYLDELQQQQPNIIVMGDMNISPTDLDVGIGADNAKRWLRTGKCSFLPEEREWLSQVEGRGLTDTFRHLYPTDGSTFSWFDYRSGGFTKDPKRGLRIDLILASKALLPKVKAAGVSYEFRGMTRPSDHCPVWAELGLG
ncbi:MAG: exodeoxyribonuclease III [Oleiphilaceae bacterium]|nr:exodeoxyribonuclease III [Oleiphilaceae bacterium]